MRSYALSVQSNRGPQPSPAAAGLPQAWPAAEAAMARARQRRIRACGAEGSVQLRYDAAKGTGLFAARALRKGERLFVEA